MTDGNCMIAGCVNRARAYGLCPTHRQRKAAGWPDWDTRPINKKLNRGKLPDYDAWEYYLYRYYGMRKGEYEKLLARQGGVCAICGNKCSTGRRLAVDHDHATGRIRGLLCSNCNTGIGKFGDSPQRLIAAANYLLSLKD